MQINFLPHPDSDSLGRLIQQVAHNGAIRSVMVLACDADQLQADQLAPFLRACPKPIFGGIFPQILHGRKIMEHGALVIGLGFSVHCGTITDLSNARTNFSEQLLNHFAQSDPAGKTMFVFVDGLSTRITDLVDALFDNLGLIPN